jgi:small GTP-binding protein
MEDVICKLIPQILVVGDGMVGKTSLIRRFVDNKFPESYIETIGSDLTFKDEYINVRTINGTGRVHIRLRIYDIGGQKQFKKNMLRYVKTSQIMVICYDITQLETFHNIEEWYAQIKSQVAINPYNHGLILVGNKHDLTADDAIIKKTHNIVDEEQIDAQRSYNSQAERGQLKLMLKKLKGNFGIETSAKSGSNVKALFENIGKIALNIFIQNEINYLKEDGVELPEITTEFVKKLNFYPDLKQI